MEASASVTPLRVVPEPDCETCVNVLFGSCGAYCRLFQVDILNTKKEAAECEAFEFDDLGGAR